MTEVLMPLSVEALRKQLKGRPKVTKARELATRFRTVRKAKGENVPSEHRLCDDTTEEFRSFDRMMQLKVYIWLLYNFIAGVEPSDQPGSHRAQLLKGAREFLKALEGVQIPGTQIEMPAILLTFCHELRRNKRDLGKHQAVTLNLCDHLILASVLLQGVSTTSVGLATGRSRLPKVIGSDSTHRAGRSMGEMAI